MDVRALPGADLTMRGLEDLALDRERVAAHHPGHGGEVPRLRRAVDALLAVDS